MTEKYNVTYLSISGFVEVTKYRYAYFFIILALFLLIIFSNSIIVYLIWTHQDLHEPMYIFIAALSVNSLLFSASIYPKFLIDFLSDKQVISYPACLFQYFMFYSSGGSDFLLLVAMAYDRYVSICKPLLYPTIMRRRNVTILLLIAWVLPAFQIAVSTVISANEQLCDLTLRGIFCNKSILKSHCKRSRVLTAFGLLGLIDLALLPALFILFTYAKILSISYRSSREVKRKAAETCLPHVLVLLSFSLLFTYDFVIAGARFNLPVVMRLIMTLQVVLYSPLLNPIIYGVKMKEISKHIRKMFCHVKLM